MKSDNLKIMKENGLNVPNFIVVTNIDEVDLSFSKSEMFAVRSSFDLEDSKEVSFAGQFDSFLNINRNDVKAAVLKVQESARAANVLDYLKLNKLEEKQQGMHVIVQEMIDADMSGVIFSSNPLGILNEIVVVVGYGLGNQVVEDKVATSSYYYNKDDGLFYLETMNDSPVLKEDTLKGLLDHCKKITEIFQHEMDIEFAIKDDVVSILQARPITTLNLDHPIILDNSNIVESYPGVSLPLTQSFIKNIYHRVFEALLKRVTKDEKLVEAMDDILQNMTEIANGRAYYRISNWYEVLRLLPFEKKIIPMWQEMLGVNNKLVSINHRKVHVKTKFTMACSLAKYLMKTPKAMKELNAFFIDYIKEAEGKLNALIASNHQSKISLLLELYYNIFTVLVERWDITLINDMYAFIYTALAGKKNKEFIANIKNLESMKPVIEINRLVDIAREKGIDSAQYQKAKENYISQYGDRCLNELKLETKTYRTNPELLDEYVLHKVDCKEAYRFSDRKENQSNNIIVKRAKLGISNREISRMNRTRIFGIARNIFLCVGAELVKQGRIEEKEDIFYLTIEELDVSVKAASLKDFKKIVSDRKMECGMQESLPSYSRLVFAEKIINKQIHIAKFEILHKSNELSGVASSAGKVTGEVIVIDSPNHTLDTRDKIIVTKMTDPGWVFLIEHAIGIIAEKGSILSHTAIITRELHKPSIVNVKDVTKLLKTGDLVEMDAYSGKITVLRHRGE